MVSIIVPVYNVKDYIETAISSVLCQTYGDWELILVDDGSTDSSGRICDKASLESNKIKVIHKNNGGMSSARNAGLDAAAGDYIFFLDSDDLLNPLALEKLLDIAINSNADIVCGGMEKFYNTESLTLCTEKINHSYLHGHKTYVKTFTPTDAIRKTLYQKTLDNSVWGKIYTRRLWENERFREGIGYEDLDIFYRIYLNANFISSIKIPLYYYRQHSESYLHKFALHRADVLDVTDRLVEYMRTFHPDLLDAAMSRQLSANFNILGLMTSNRHYSHKEDAKALDISEKCWKKIKELRGRCLRNPSVRLKNKIGILLSYMGGRRLIETLSPILYK